MDAEGDDGAKDKEEFSEVKVKEETPEIEDQKESAEAEVKEKPSEIEGKEEVPETEVKEETFEEEVEEEILETEVKEEIPEPEVKEEVPEIDDDVAILETINQEPPEEKYEKALQETVTVSNGDGTETILEPSPYQGLVSDPTNLTPEMIDYYLETIDLKELNKEFGTLLNAARMSQGRPPVEYMPAYQEGANTRAKELADIGDIRVDNQPHVRLDGRPHDTAYDYLGKDKGGVGENLAGMNYDGNPYELVSEKYLAESAYTQWLNSPGHKVNQEDPEYDGYALSVVPMSDISWSEMTYDSGYVAALALVDKQ